ncbi:hypothetical protein [Methylovulum psychrotolerans]|uniref:3-keto-disaccharide hydrolase domain-containing protein n=1 Tax=Methylovulum psychrotolerans TaxID=1704499 RepID=A0A2S5CGC1_9GAMM|nr:hypothetical protein [Methylovulum psychrotolerans]POZ49849.1 hypothetical protein AADEFJLK_04365 [Methylovulum psychrotolerans]
MANSKLLNLSTLLLFVVFNTAASGEVFIDDFDNVATLSETGNMSDSPDPHWWLNSGAYFYRANGIASTVTGELSGIDRFRLLYAASNPIDTDNGYRPQNIFRLVTLGKFKNFTQQVFFNIKNINLSASPNRNQSNGVLFFHRYQDGKNLYYAGIRVDGFAIVKKKSQGRYYELKSVAVYPGAYNRETLPNLLPVNRWVGLKTVIADTANGSVDISLYLNDQQLGPGWTKVLEIEDTGADIERILTPGYAGIRSDFMDVNFNHYEAAENQN